jgi:predicted dehydrogenase
MTRDEHIQERTLAAEKDVFWKVDFIERESPVVKKAVEVLEDENIESIEVHRESSVGIQKLLNPVKRSGVVGGDILDKMTHEIFIYDLLRAADHDTQLEFESGSAEYFMPKNISSDKMMNIYGGSTRDIDNQTATGMTEAKFSTGDIEVVLNSSWMGASQKTEEWNEKIEMDVVESDFSLEADSAFTSEEARFFVVKGSRNLLGDLLHGRLLDLDTGELIQTPDLMHDQLYRVLRKAVEDAADHKRANPNADEIDDFMNAVFDARDHVTEKASEFFEELQKANQRVDRMTAEDKIIEDSELQNITG